MTEDSKVKMTELKSALELEQKQSEINLLDAQKQRQRFLSLGIGLIALLFAVFIVLLRRNQKRIEQQKAELTALNTTKDKLFALLSHDLMSPVATLKNYMMLIDFGAMSQSEFAETAQSLKRNINNVHSMLENVLHWAISQMRDTKPKLEQVNISDVVDEQIALIEPIAKGKGIEIKQTIPTDLMLTLDKNHLVLIIRNLLQNALKFTNSGGSIVFNSENTEGGKKIISISDNGMGMTTEMVDRLFKLNENTHQKGTANEGGTGLGLILTKELVELNGGTIEVASEVGKGTTFTLAFA